MHIVVYADVEYGIFSMDTIPQDVPMRILWKKGFIRLLLVGGILWMLLILVVLLFQVWSCQSSIAFISGIVGKVLADFHVICFNDLMSSVCVCVCLCGQCFFFVALMCV